MPQFFSSQQIQTKLDLIFQDQQLLKMAFTHRSYWNENKELASGHNERLEFLGDSVLGLLIADYLYQQHPDLEEGPLSNLRSQLVDAPACAGYVTALDIGSFLLLGKGEQMNQGKGRESIMADLFEALIGALYLDQGLEAAKDFLFARFKERIDQLVEKPLRNWKAELQDYAQKNIQQTPLYQVIEETGPAHKKHFVVGVWIGQEEIATGEGESKKEAQVQAAKNALLKIEGS